MPSFATAAETDSNGHDVLVVTGDLDMLTADDFASTVIDWARFADSEPPLRLDLAGVGFVDSSGLGALIRIRRAAMHHGSTVAIVDRSILVDRVLMMTGLDRLFASPAPGV